jgi:16S rRNA processing protein RimM
MAGELVVVGYVRRAHGIHGEILVHAKSDRAEAVFAPGRRLILETVGGERSELMVTAFRPHRGGYLLGVDGVESRSGAETLAGRELLLPAEELEPLEPGEVFVHDLVGLDVFDTAGERVGRVRQVYLSEPADLLEVRAADRLVLVPFTARIVREVDVAGGRVVIDPPEGLLEL